MLSKYTKIYTKFEIIYPKTAFASFLKLCEEYLPRPSLLGGHGIRLFIPTRIEFLYQGITALPETVRTPQQVSVSVVAGPPAQYCPDQANARLNKMDPLVQYIPDIHIQSDHVDGC